MKELFTAAELKRLISQGEGQFIEFKSLWNLKDGQRKSLSRRAARDFVAEYVAAFANADGRVLLQPSGGYASNLLGLSDQVPMKIVFLTDGPARRVQIGKQVIMLKHTTPRAMATAGLVSGLVIQALRHIGQQYVDDTIVARPKKRLSDDDKKQLLQDIRYAPSRIAAILRRVAGSREQ